MDTITGARAEALEDSPAGTVHRAAPVLAVYDTSYGDVRIETEAAAAHGVAIRSAIEDRSQADGADGVLVQYATITAETMDAHPEWRVIGRYGVGVDTIALAAARERRIAVVNVPDYCEEEVATHAASLVLAATRKLLPADRMVREGRWGDWAQLRPILPLSGCTLGLVGTGRIGRATARLLSPFFGSVIAYDPAATEPVPGVELVDFDEVVRRSDVLSLHCPLLPETAHLIDADVLAAMKPTSYLVNVSRGGLVDSAALARALRAGRLAGAALDVLETEPPAPDDPLLDAPNLLVTNHLAWYSQESERRLRHLLAERCAAVLTASSTAVPA